MNTIEFYFSDKNEFPPKGDLRFNDDWSIEGIETGYGNKINEWLESQKTNLNADKLLEILLKPRGEVVEAIIEFVKSNFLEPSFLKSNLHIIGVGYYYHDAEIIYFMPLILMSQGKKLKNITNINKLANIISNKKNKSIKIFVKYKIGEEAKIEIIYSTDDLPEDEGTIGKMNYQPANLLKNWITNKDKFKINITEIKIESFDNFVKYLKNKIENLIKKECQIITIKYFIQDKQIKKEFNNIEVINVKNDNFYQLKSSLSPTIMKKKMITFLVHYKIIKKEIGPITPMEGKTPKKEIKKSSEGLKAKEGKGEQITLERKKELQRNIQKAVAQQSDLQSDLQSIQSFLQRIPGQEQSLLQPIQSDVQRKEETTKITTEKLDSLKDILDAINKRLETTEKMEEEGKEEETEETEKTPKKETTTEKTEGEETEETEKTETEKTEEGKEEETEEKEKTPKKETTKTETEKLDALKNALEKVKKEINILEKIQKGEILNDEEIKIIKDLLASFGEKKKSTEIKSTKEGNKLLSIFKGERKKSLSIGEPIMREVSPSLSPITMVIKQSPFDNGNMNKYMKGGYNKRSSDYLFNEIYMKKALKYKKKCKYLLNKSLNK